MMRGTNAQFKFKLPCNLSDIEYAKIVFWQPYNDGPSVDRPLPIVKMLDQCSSTNVQTELLITLNKEETLRFSEDRKAYVQLMAFKSDGEPITHREQAITVYPVNGALLDHEILPEPSAGGWVYLDGDVIIEGGADV